MKFTTKDSGKRQDYDSEAWEAIAEFPHYEVSTLGRIRRVVYRRREYPKIMKPKTHKQGYKEICLCDFEQIPSKRHTRLVHRLVAQTFLSNIHGLKEVNHKNGNKSDNGVRNLEWVTPQENVRHGLRHGLIKKLDEDMVRSIREMYRLSGKTQKDIGKLFDVKPNTVSQVCSGARWGWL